MSNGREEIPEEFDSLEEEAEFWENFDTSKIWDDLEDADEIEFEQPDKQVVSFRMNRDHIEKIKRYAKTLDTPYTSLMRLWVMRAFRQEVQSTSAKRRKDDEDYYTPQHLTRYISDTEQQATETPIKRTHEGITEVDTKALKTNQERVDSYE